MVDISPAVKLGLDERNETHRALATAILDTERLAEDVTLTVCGEDMVELSVYGEQVMTINAAVLTAIITSLGSGIVATGQELREHCRTALTAHEALPQSSEFGYC